MKKPELLAPAGDMACLKAAINAGADAVYLGGEEYGARAYASNFSKEELCEAVSYAHVFGVRLYLTVNTLIKEREFNNLTDFIAPVYEAGLDGVIVQDLGVLKRLKECFPDLELHASTQMCITNAYGARLLKEYGVSRIVPARELSLDELIKIKKEADVEIECFVHGAMCYCYSGQCLFSSFLGGRSGNRGRCAGPCRLPYEAFGKKDRYPLSLKDMCTISMIGELIDAGMDSFKIEGRMKNPTYVAGVTSIYRKYIDLYVEADTPNGEITIEKEDMEILQNLYIRTELQAGYYHRHNGKEMLTMQKPGYASAPDALFSEIKRRYLDTDKKIAITGELTVKKGSPLKLKINDENGHETIAYSEELVSEAEKRPVTSEEIEKQIHKTGNTAFYFETFSVIMDDNVFVSLKALGEIKRTALEDFRRKLTGSFDRNGKIKRKADIPKEYPVQKQYDVKSNCRSFRIFCRTKEQLLCVADYIGQYRGESVIDGIEIQAFILENIDNGLREKLYALKKNGIGIYLVLPPVFRSHAFDWAERHKKIVFSDLFDGYYCNGPDSFAYVKSCLPEGHKKQIIADHALYICNYEAASFMQKQGATGFVVPYELTHYEWLDLKKRLSDADSTEPYQEYCIYGHIPFMQTANCIKKSFDSCDGKDDVITVKDRMGKDLFIATQCEVCENTIYNGIPLSLHKEVDTICADALRIGFTTETKEEVLRILQMFSDRRDVSLKDFTKGHFKKGIE